MKIGFVGLGRMGSGLAKNLIRANYDVLLFDVYQPAIDRIFTEVGGTAAKSAQALAEQVDILFTSLPMPSDVQSLFMGADGLFGCMKPNAIVIDVSTIDPQTARTLADAAAQYGLRYLECPLGKGPKQAEEGTEPIFAGGVRDVFDAVLPILEKIGQPVYYLGDVEQSTAFKLISNMIGMTNMVVLAEGLRLGERAGIEPELLQTLLAQTGADSYQLHLRGPWLLADDYAPRFSVDLTAKDLNLGVGMAEAWGQSADLTKLALQYFRKVQEAGFGQEDTNAVYKVL